MKTEHIQALPMILSPVQRGDAWLRTADGIFAPDTSRATLFCRDMRPSETCGLEGTPAPKTLAALNGKYVATDVRDGSRNIFTLRDRHLFFEGTLDFDGNFRRLDIDLGDPGAEVVAADSAGSFFIFLLSDNTLYYLLWEWDLGLYTVLGAPPSLPEITVEAEETAPFTGHVPAVGFKAPADIRSGIPDAEKSLVAAVMKTAWEEAAAEAAGARQYISPPVLEVIVRLWDGSAYRTSGELVPDIPWPVPGRVELTPVMENGKCTGCSEGVFSIPAFNLRVKIGDAAPGKWDSVIRAVEVYVTRPQKLLSGRDAGVVYSSETQKIFATFSLRDVASLRSSLLLEPRYLAATFEPGGADRTVSIPDAVNPLVNPAKKVSVPSSVQAITGHDSYIHSAGGTTVVTSHYGNPLVAADATDTGARVLFMRAQVCGGGAYTRQYIYLFTTAGIMALVHDKEGRHTQCRTISREFVSSPRRVCATDRGLWVLTDNGTLMLVRDCRVEPAMRLLGGGGSLGWDAMRGELWITPADTSEKGWKACLVIIPSDGVIMGYMRSVRATEILPGTGQLACIVSGGSDPSKSLLVIPDCYEDGSRCASTSRWVARTAYAPTGKEAAYIAFDGYGEELSAMYQLSCANPAPRRQTRISPFERGEIVWRTESAGTDPLGGRKETLVAGPECPALLRTGVMILEARGTVPCFGGVTVTPRQTGRFRSPAAPALRL